MHRRHEGLASSHLTFRSLAKVSRFEADYVIDNILASVTTVMRLPDGQSSRPFRCGGHGRGAFLPQGAVVSDACEHGAILGAEGDGQHPRGEAH